MPFSNDALGTGTELPLPEVAVAVGVWVVVDEGVTVAVSVGVLVTVGVLVAVGPTVLAVVAVGVAVAVVAQSRAKSSAQARSPLRMSQRMSRRPVNGAAGVVKVTDIGAQSPPALRNGLWDTRVTGLVCTKRIATPNPVDVWAIFTQPLNVHVAFAGREAAGLGYVYW